METAKEQSNFLTLGLTPHLGTHMVIKPALHQKILLIIKFGVYYSLQILINIHEK